MQTFTVSGIEVQIEDGKRYRVNKTIGGVKKEGDWRPLPIQESELSLTTMPASDLAIAVSAHERLNDGSTILRDLLTKSR
jgi:hypothetical protein